MIRCPDRASIVGPGKASLTIYTRFKTPSGRRRAEVTRQLYSRVVALRKTCSSGWSRELLSPGVCPDLPPVQDEGFHAARLRPRPELGSVVMKMVVARAKSIVSVRMPAFCRGFSQPVPGHLVSQPPWMTSPPHLRRHLIEPIKALAVVNALCLDLSTDTSMPCKVDAGLTSSKEIVLMTTRQEGTFCRCGQRRRR